MQRVGPWIIILQDYNCLLVIGLASAVMGRFLRKNIFLNTFFYVAFEYILID